MNKCKSKKNITSLSWLGLAIQVLPILVLSLSVYAQHVERGPAQHAISTIISSALYDAIRVACADKVIYSDEYAFSIDAKEPIRDLEFLHELNKKYQATIDVINAAPSCCMLMVYSTVGDSGQMLREYKEARRIGGALLPQEFLVYGRK